MVVVASLAGSVLSGWPGLRLRFVCDGARRAVRAFDKDRVGARCVAGLFVSVRLV